MRRPGEAGHDLPSGSQELSHTHPQASSPSITGRESEPKGPPQSPSDGHQGGGECFTASLRIPQALGAGRQRKEGTHPAAGWGGGLEGPPHTHPPLATRTYCCRGTGHWGQEGRGLLPFSMGTAGRILAVPKPAGGAQQTDCCCC